LCLGLGLFGSFGSIACSSGSYAPAFVEESIYTDFVQEWGLDELADIVSQQSNREALMGVSTSMGEDSSSAVILLRALGAPLQAGSEGLRAWAAADPILSSTLAMPLIPAPLAAAPAMGQMQAWLQEAIGAGLSTGYNIVPESIWPAFDPSRTLIYGHTSMRHARQLLLLLRLAGLDPEFSFVPKSSAFRYREEWGGSTEGFLELSDGGKLVVSEEYDLFLSFVESEALVRFAEIVTAYAKKDEPDEQGLIYQAWWQPFYRAFKSVDSMPEARVVLVRYQGYRANILSLPEDSVAKRSDFADRFPEMQFEIIPIWVNPSFYRYIEGGFR
jgi:hypothetical protein